MSALDRLSSDRDRDNPTKAGAADNPLSVANLRVVPGARHLTERYAEMRQSFESEWDRDRPFDAPRAELARFRTERAGLPETSPEQAARYVKEHRNERPWLEVAERASPESLRILVAVDQGSGHGHIRHEGWVTEAANMRRVAYLEDPAQLDGVKRLRGIDGLVPNDNQHRCGYLATRITDLGAFATAFARGVELPDMRAALSVPYHRGRLPDPVKVPIIDLLGKDGHKFCSGWQLEPVAGRIDVARNNRQAWRTALAEGRVPDVLEPRAQPIPTFEGGVITFIVSRNKARDGYEISSLYPRPLDHDLSKYRTSHQ